MLCVLLLLLMGPLPAGCSDSVKEPAVSGTFYPSDKKGLEQAVRGFLKNATLKKQDGTLVALISPHAGYQYSGQVAAHGYAQLSDSGIDTVILLGTAHRTRFKGASVYTKGSFRTPLGIVKADEVKAATLLSKSAGVTFFPDAFTDEHSLEVQLPFLQTVLKDFTVVPVLIGSPTAEMFEHLVLSLTELMDEHTLLIASTDLSHYHNSLFADAMDSKIISAITRLSSADTRELLQKGDSELCGAFPVLITIEVARIAGASFGVVFNRAHSGDVTGEKERVVGYTSIGLYKSPLTDADRASLLSLARKTVHEYVSHGTMPETGINNPKLNSDGAVFVTLHKNGSLRGCIGHVHPVMPLFRSVMENAVAASSRDPRFPPVTKEELSDISVEISVLSPLRKLKATDDIEIGRHGLLIRKGGRQGLLLPQVAVEYGWDREAFLKNLSLKAGLPEDAWKSSDIYSFTAEIIK
jgi:AmmeMemoRadiSam system protein B/AmmeMemoRadiSam system protein A